MEKETHKLTVGGTPRYDRSMAEAATMERANVEAAWIEYRNKPGNKNIGFAEEQSIRAAIKKGYTPATIPDGLEEFTKKYMDEEFSKIAERGTEERERTKLEQNIDAFVESLKTQEDSLVKEGRSHPKDSEGGKHVDKNGKVFETKKILREEIDWGKIGWGEDDKAKVENELKSKFGWKKDSDQVKSAIDLLISTGKTAKQIVDHIQKTPLGEISPDDVARQEGSKEKAKAIKARQYFADMGISEKNVERFILFKEFHDHLEYRYQNDNPANIEEIAWQVMHYYKHDDWGPNGNFPLLEMRIGYHRNDKGDILEENGIKKVDPSKSKYYLNQANFVRWARERMWNVFDINNDVGDFMSAIELKKSYRPLTFQDMFPAYTQYFASEDGETKYYLMAQELITESYGLGLMNQMKTKYNQTMGDPKKLIETMGEMFQSNAFTKETFRKNLFQLMSIIPLNYEGNKPGELLKNDGLFGAGMIEMFLVYYNLSDFDELQRILGKESSFFTKDGYMQALQTVVSDKVSESSGESRPIVLGPEAQEWFEKAYDENGEITTQENKDYFIKLINFFAIKMDNPDAEYTVRRMLYKVIAEKYGRALRHKDGDKKGQVIEEEIFLKDPSRGKIKSKFITKYGLTSDIEGKNNDTWSLRMMWVAANAMSRVFGAGMRNDTAAAGYDAMTKMHNEETYRKKMLTYGRGMGNPYTVPQFKIFAMDPMNAILTESFDIVDGKKRAKPWRQVMEEIQATMSVSTMAVKQFEREHDEMPPDSPEKERKRRPLEDYFKTRDGEYQILVEQLARLKQFEREYDEMPPDSPEKERKRRQLVDSFKEVWDEKYQNKAGELSFKQRAMSNYFDDHLMRAHQVYDLINNAEEMNMEKYVEEDMLGVHFNRAKFQKDVQDRMITPIRYFINTYPDIDYSASFKMLDQAATIRARDKKLGNPNARPIYREMTLGEAMFGHELLNRADFWKREKLANGKEGKPINMRDKNGRPMKGFYEIDYKKVNNNKELLCKQYFLTKIAADLHSHRAFHSTDTRFGIDYYSSVISAIGAIPGSLDSDDLSLRQAVTGHYFNEKDMRWFRKVVKTENYDLYLRAIFKDLLAPKDEKEGGIGILAMLGIFTSQIVKQAA